MVADREGGGGKEGELDQLCARVPLLRSFGKPSLPSLPFQRMEGKHHGMELYKAKQ